MTDSDPTARPPKAAAEQLSLYDLFIGILTVISLGVMAAQFLLPASAPTQEVLAMMDLLFCAIFLTDFFGRLWKAHPKREYLVWQGIVDLLGSIPAFPALRFFRLFRLARVARILQVGGPKQLIYEFTSRRAESALYITVTLALLVIMFGSFAVLAFEVRAPDANIETGGDAVWWSIVSITTVGYGDRYPVSQGGRLVAILTMIMGIGLFGVLTSVLATKFMQPTQQEETESGATRADVDRLMQKLQGISERLDHLEDRLE